MRKKIDIRHLAAALLAALMLLACLPVTQADAAGNTLHISCGIWPPAARWTPGPAIKTWCWTAT